MDAPKARVMDGRVRVVAVHCPRLGCQRTVAEHRTCPYCFGGDLEVAWGDHALFCDYRPNTDATHFGFPTDTARSRA